MKSWLGVPALLLMLAPRSYANSDGAQCDLPPAKPAPSKQVLKFKSETTHGQVLSPGEKPPATTLEQSQKDLAPRTTAQTQPPR